MKPSSCFRLLAVCFTLSLWTCIASGAEPTPAHFEELGAKVTSHEGTITELQFRNSRFLNKEGWEAIGSLKGLKKLTVYGGAKSLNDETVHHLVKLQQLESLSTDGAQFSDKGLAELARLKNLHTAAFFHLSFRMEGFTGAGFAAWKDLPNLKRLTVAGMSMGDEGFDAISGIKSLTDLRTWHTYRTEASNAMIARLPNLKSLRIGQRLPQRGGAPLSLSNESVPVIAGIKSLERLEIGEADFSVKALAGLAKAPSLKQVKVYNTFLKESDIEALKKQLPDIKVIFEPQTDDQRKKLETYLK